MSVHGEKVVSVDINNKSNTGMRIDCHFSSTGFFFPKPRGLGAWIKLGSDDRK